MKNLNYIQIAIQLRSELITEQEYTDYDGSTQYMPCSPHLPTFKESHNLAKSSYAGYLFPPYGCQGMYTTNRRTSKSVRKQIEHQFRFTNFEMENVWKNE